MNPIIRRDHYLQKLIDRKENGLIKVITGIRRCGKSFLLFDLFYDHLIESGVREEQIIPIALDDDMFTKYRDPDELSRFIRSKIVSKEMYYILIDEVQYAIAKDELKDPGVHPAVQRAQWPHAASQCGYLCDRQQLENADKGCSDRFPRPRR